MFGLFKKEPEVPPQPLTPAQTWAWATAALPVLNFGAKMEYLGGYAPTEKNAKGVGKVLKYNWNVESKEQLMETLAWLQQTGHRQQFAQQTGEQAGQFLGWDLGRYISVAGYGFVAGYLTEEEAWGMILPAAKNLQQQFQSWQELGNSYIHGREVWGEDKDGNEDLRKLMQELLAPGGLWVTVPWNTAL